VLKVLPTAYYTPETRIALEGFAYLSFYSKNAERASNARVFVAVTQNRQLLVDLPWQIFTAGEEFRITGKWDIKKFPEKFYGIGNNTEETTQETYTYRSTGITNRFQRKLTTNNYFGVGLDGRILGAMLPYSTLHEISDTNNIIGESGYKVAGIGPTFIHDSRDIILCPKKGTFLEATLLFNGGRAENVDLTYTKLILDYRQYFSLPKNTVICYQVSAQSTIGDVPYRELPTLGGPLMHRGYYFGRFRDKHLVFTQAEVRKHLFWRLGAAAFGSVGRVYEDFDTILFRKYHPAVGGGLRFKLSKKADANIRFDVAVTPDSKGFYVYFAEAF
jgi:outer membrane protein assembly factor BamA